MKTERILMSILFLCCVVACACAMISLVHTPVSSVQIAHHAASQAVQAAQAAQAVGAA